MFEEFEKRLEKRQEELRKMMPKFETQEEAFAYAKRLMELQPGQQVKVPDGNVLVDAIFTGQYDKDGDPQTLIYERQEKRLKNNIVAIYQIVLD